jgi:hypothetical protein
MATTYGVISDMHFIPLECLPPVIEVLKGLEADALVLNGDLSGENTNFKDYLPNVFDIAGKSGFESYFTLGNHDNREDFIELIKYFSDKYPNLLNTLKYPVVEEEDHDLLFLSPSHNLTKLITRPDKTICFSHYPQKFKTERGVDFARFYELEKTFKLDDGAKIERGTILTEDYGKELEGRGAQVKLRKENRGMEKLGGLYKELGINKVVSGHFHESAGKFHDSLENQIEEGLFVNELFVNASCLDNLIVGMVTIDGSKVAYEKVNLRDYINKSPLK